MRAKSKNPDKQAPGQAILEAAVFANSYKSLATAADSTGLVTNVLRYRTLSTSTRPRVAEEFLVNTRLTRRDRATEVSIESYFSQPSMAMLSMPSSEITESDELILPKPSGLRMEMGEVLSNRRSVRSYTGDKMELADLSAIVEGSSGVTAESTIGRDGDSQFTMRFRAAPSGGGLYPLELCVAAMNINGLDRGLYRFNPERHSMKLLGSPSVVDKLLSCFAVPENVISLKLAAAVFLLVGQPWKSMRKYGNRGMRLVFLEAGAIAEHINLISVALGYGSVDCSSVYDDEANEVMELDGLFRTLIHTVIVGNPG